MGLLAPFVLPSGNSYLFSNQYKYFADNNYFSFLTDAEIERTSDKIYEIYSAKEEFVLLKGGTNNNKIAGFNGKINTNKSCYLYLEKEIVNMGKVGIVFLAQELLHDFERNYPQQIIIAEQKYHWFERAAKKNMNTSISSIARWKCLVANILNSKRISGKITDPSICVKVEEPKQKEAERDTRPKFFQSTLSDESLYVSYDLSA